MPQELAVVTTSTKFLSGAYIVVVEQNKATRPIPTIAIAFVVLVMDGVFLCFFLSSFFFGIF
jgi:hypothetical protein